jgi:hypothetical protein
MPGGAEGRGLEWGKIPIEETIQLGNVRTTVNFAVFAARFLACGRGSNERDDPLIARKPLSYLLASIELTRGHLGS